MLSRTADHLFWMARYMERAENTARMLDVNYQMSLLPQSEQAAERGWRGVLSINEISGDFARRNSSLTPRSVIDYMVNDAANGSSIRSCLMAARENARAVRGTLTTEVWETQNQTWLEFQRLIADDAFQKGPGEAFEWVKFRSHLSRGVTVGTMLQDEEFHFLRIDASSSAPTTRRACSRQVPLGRARPLRQRPRRDRRAAATLRAGGEPDPAEPSQSGGGSQARAQSQSQSREGGGKDVEFGFYHWSAVLRSVSGFGSTARSTAT